MFRPDCDAWHADTRRLCVCRPSLLGADTLELIHPQDASHEASLRQSLVEQRFAAADAVEDAREIEMDEEPSPTNISGRPSKVLQDAGWKDGVLAKQYAEGIAGFASPDSSIDDLVYPQDLSIVVTATSMGATDLRASLSALRQAEGLRTEQVLVVQDTSNAGPEAVQLVTKIIETEFQFEHVQHNVSDATEGVRMTSQLRFALQHAAGVHFKGARTLIVVQEGTVLASDALWFFAQLEPILHKDTSVWCVTALNDVGLSPYSSDLTAVLRQDWFPGFAWMARRDVLLNELLPKWPKDNWFQFLRDPATRMDRHCLYPEVSRAKLSPVPSLSLVQVAQLEHKGEGFSTWEDHMIPLYWSDGWPRTNLGDTRRLLQSNYEDLFLREWPG
eukprot:4722467-Amphidinium_carterae.1